MRSPSGHNGIVLGVCAVLAILMVPSLTAAQFSPDSGGGNSILGGLGIPGKMEFSYDRYRSERTTYPEWMVNYTLPVKVGAGGPAVVRLYGAKGNITGVDDVAPSPLSMTRVGAEGAYLTHLGSDLYAGLKGFYDTAKSSGLSAGRIGASAHLGFGLGRFHSGTIAMSYFGYTHASDGPGVLTGGKDGYSLRVQYLVKSDEFRSSLKLKLAGYEYWPLLGTKVHGGYVGAYVTFYDFLTIKALAGRDGLRGTYSTLGGSFSVAF